MAGTGEGGHPPGIRGQNNGRPCDQRGTQRAIVPRAQTPVYSHGADMPTAPLSRPAQKLPCFRLFVYVNYNSAFNYATGRASATREVLIGLASPGHSGWCGRGLGGGDAPGPLTQRTRPRGEGARRSSPPRGGSGAPEEQGPSRRARHGTARHSLARPSA